MIVCPKCGENDFYIEKSGRQRCRPCQKERMRKIYATPEYKAKHRDDDRRRRRNCNKEMYDKLIVEQNGKCAICGGYFGEALEVDHDHDSMKVRGLLCHCCNVGIGFFKDKLAILEKAQEYLLKNK